MKIGEYEVVVTGRDAVKVGCVEVTREQAQGVLRQMDEYREGLVPSEMPFNQLGVCIGKTWNGHLFVRSPLSIIRMYPNDVGHTEGNSDFYNAARIRLITPTELSAFVAQLLKGETK